MSSPTSRSLDRLRADGWTVQVVEQFVRFPPPGHRKDLFGVIDLVAIKPGLPILGVQACAGASHSARRAKALAEPRLLTWLAAGGRFEVWSWAKRRSTDTLRDGSRSRAQVWTLRVEALTGQDIADAARAAADALCG